jgi:hypothetical protein
MIDEMDTETFAVPDEPKSSARILAGLRKAESAFREWQVECAHIDRIYNRDGYAYAGRNTLDDGYGWQDATLDLFWSSFEVMKPAIYARPPQPVVAPLFKDGTRAPNVAAELLERCAVSVFKRTNMDDVMRLVRDDLLFGGRGVMWLRYEVEEGRQHVCVEHKDRLDFLHEPTRTWSEVGWVAGAAYLTRKEMRKRFGKTSGDAYKDAQYTQRHDDQQDAQEERATARKCKVWEVWHKADKRVYWVAEGVEVFLDDQPPHLDIDGFFPCPRPAYATLRRRSLIPVPDWQRYAVHFDKISKLTSRIYALLDDVRMKGLIPAGGDVGDAVEELIRSDDARLLIPVPAAAMAAQGAAGFVMWLPLRELAEAIQGLIAAREQLINDFYQLSGISDIMRGATEAEETLGAQQLKSQYGSVRVREKSAELQRVAADAVKIAAEIIAQKFSRKTMLDMSRMEIPTREAIEERVAEVEKAAKKDLEGLGEKAQQAVQQQQEQVDPQQAQMMLQQAQQQVLAKYAPLLADAEQQVPIEDVEKLIKDERTRCFTFEIESSSTILTDELEEKASRNEFLREFTSASAGLMSLAGLGEPGAKLAGAMMKFVLAPYRAGRELDGAIDEFIEAAPEMAQAAKGEEGDDAGLVEANKKLAEAEQMKAQAAMAGVQAKAQLDQAENQRKFAELQQKAAKDTLAAEQEAEKLRLQVAQMGLDAEEQQAKINHLQAQTAKILASIGLDERKQELSEYTAAESAQQARVNTAMQAENAETEREFRERGESRADRQQEFAEATTKETENG